jgi:hypothetical protein
MTQFVSRELVRSGIVRALRTVFESNQDFQYRVHPSDPNQPAEDSGVYVYDAWPWKRIGYPAIIVTLGPGNPMMRTLGGEIKSVSTTDFVSQDGLTHSNVDSETYGGGIETTVNIRVYARSGIERSRVMDWIAFYIRHWFVDVFQKQGVTVVDMAHGGEDVQQVGNDPVYVDTLSVTVYSEFERTISTELAGTIQAMSLTNVFSILPGGSAE